ncbi:MAG: hypothetical protein KAT05_11935 [Spirochaetes bacterium]|nr:hypothetical protein [Spirochaetota bacterium]
MMPDKAAKSINSNVLLNTYKKYMIKNNILKKKPIFFCILILISLSAILAYNYFNIIEKPECSARISLHKDILNKTAPSPYRYRILVPYTIELVIKFLTCFISYTYAFLLSYFLFNFITFSLMLITIFLFLNYFFTTEQSFIGTLITCSTMPIVFRNHYFQPWSFLEVVFFTLSLILIYKNNILLLFFLMIIGTLNRETTLFIPFIYLFVNINLINIIKIKKINLKNNSKYFIYFFLLIITWIFIYFSLRYLQGFTEHIHTIKDIWIKNTTKKHLTRAIINNSLFLGIIWIYIILGFKKAPNFIKNTSFILPIYFLLILIYGIWYEVRLLMPLYPIFISLGLSFIFYKRKIDSWDDY